MAFVNMAREARPGAAEALLAIESVVVRDALEMEMLLRRTQSYGTRVPSYRLVCLARVIDNIVSTTADCAEAVLQCLGEGSIDSMEVRNLRYLGRQVCAMATTDAIFDFLAPIANTVIDISTKAMKMELPLEELREMLRQARDDVAAVRDHKVNLNPRRSMVESAPFADEGGDMTVSSLAEVKAFVEQFSDGRPASANSTVVLGGLMLQDATTVCYILDHYQSSVANWKPLEVLASLDDCLAFAGADIDHLIGVLDANGDAYKEIPELLGDEEQLFVEYHSPPARRLLDNGEGIVRLARQMPGFDSLALLGERMSAAARQALAHDLQPPVHLSGELRGIIPDIEASRGMWFPFPASTALCSTESEV